MKLFIQIATFMAVVALPISLYTATRADRIKTAEECKKLGRKGNNWGSYWENGVCYVY